MGLTNLESLITSLIGFYSRRAFNSRVTTTASFVSLSATSKPAQIVYISNTTEKPLLVSTDGGVNYIIVPDGNIFPLMHISDLSAVSIKTDDSTAGLVVTFRYEV